MAPVVRVAKGNPEFHGLNEAWRRYRQVEGLLNDKTIEKFLEQYGRLENIAKAVYSHLRDRIGGTMASSLEKRLFCHTMLFYLVSQD
jgi:hypothetical protein